MGATVAFSLLLSAWSSAAAPLTLPAPDPVRATPLAVQAGLAPMTSPQPSWQAVASDAPSDVEGGGCFSLHLPVMSADLEPEVEKEFWFIYVTHVLLGDTCGPFWIAPLWVGYWPEDYAWDATVTWLVHMWMYPLSMVCGCCYLAPFAVNKLYLFPIASINTYNYHLKRAKAEGKDTRPAHVQKAEAAKRKREMEAAEREIQKKEEERERQVRDRRVLEERQRLEAERLKAQAAEAARLKAAEEAAAAAQAAAAEAERAADVGADGLPKVSPEARMDAPEAVEDTAPAPGGADSPRTPRDRFNY